MSLLKEVKEEAKNKYPEVYKDNNSKISELKTTVFSANFLQILSFFLVSIILVFFYTNFIDFNALKIINVNFEDNIKTFTTCTITLVSMNLFVTNLLFTHLKDERDDIQSIIDEKVNFKFITYFGFSIVICTLLLYFISSTIGNQNINSNILILIFISFIFYIFQLVQLYNVVFNFIHKVKRIEIIKSELQLEFSRAFYSEFLKKEFNSRYQNFIEKEHHFKEYISWDIQNENLNNISITKNKVSYLKDINIKHLSKKLKEINPKEKYYHKLVLDKEYAKNSTISVLTFSNEIKVNFSKYYSFSSKRNLIEKYKQEHLDRILKKVESNTLNNKYLDLKNNLNDLEDIYLKYIELEE